MNIEEINIKKANVICESFKPLGLFYFQDNGFYVGIDNSTGDAITEEFDEMNDCISWLMYGPDGEGKSIETQQLEIFNHYGMEAQLEILIEECSEVIQAICKYKRSLKNLNNPNILGSIIEEIADVKNIIEQLELSNDYISMRVELLKESKVKRQIKRINKLKEAN